MQEWKKDCIVGIVAALLLVGWTAGCGTAKADPLDVTYYYLPG